MEITGYYLCRSRWHGSIAYGQVCFDNQLWVDIEIVNGRNGDFVRWARYKKPDGTYRSCVYVQGRELSDQWQNQIIRHWNDYGESRNTPRTNSGGNSRDQRRQRRDSYDNRQDNRDTRRDPPRQQQRQEPRREERRDERENFDVDSLPDLDDVLELPI